MHFQWEILTSVIDFNLAPRLNKVLKSIPVSTAYLNPLFYRTCLWIIYADCAKLCKNVEKSDKAISQISRACNCKMTTKFLKQRRATLWVFPITDWLALWSTSWILNFIISVIYLKTHPTASITFFKINFVTTTKLLKPPHSPTEYRVTPQVFMDTCFKLWRPWFLFFFIFWHLHLGHKL